MASILLEVEMLHTVLEVTDLRVGGDELLADISLSSFHSQSYLQSP